MQVEMLSQAHAEQATTIEDLSAQLEQAQATQRAAAEETAAEALRAGDQQGTDRAESQRVDGERAAAEQAAAAAEEKALQLEHQLQVCMFKQHCLTMPCAKYMELKEEGGCCFIDLFMSKRRRSWHQGNSWSSS
jgi:uncharacterized protein involved in type VI secretion and phage assembly